MQPVLDAGSDEDDFSGRFFCTQNLTFCSEIMILKDLKLHLFQMAYCIRLKKLNPQAFV